MKKIILLLVITLAFTFTNAQKAKIGAKVGLNVANTNFTGESVPSMSSVANLHVGGFAEFNISKKVSFQPELLYSMQGSKFSQAVVLNETVYNTNNTFKLSYINVPLMFKYYPQEKFYFETGPQIGFLTSSKLEVEVSNYGTNTQDAKELFESLDFGLNFGLGYNFTKRITSNVRYNFGLTNIAKTESGDDTTINNRVFSVSLGYIF